MQATRTSLAASRAYHVGISGIFVDDNIVCGSELLIDLITGKDHGRVGDIAQPCQVEDLHPVVSGFAHDEHVIE